MRHVLSLLASLLALASCSDEAPRTQVMAVILAESGVAASSARVQVRVVSLSGGADTGIDESVALSTRPFPINVAILPLGGDTTRRFRLEVDALDASDSLITSARVESGFVAERTLGLVVWLRDDCVGVSCDPSETCEVGGRCVSVVREPDTLPDLENLDASMPTDAGMDADTSTDADAGDTAVDTRVCETRETACVDGLDEDCDGLTDCEDDDCNGQTCDDGFYCNGVDFCMGGGCDGHPGDPCVAPSVCNEGTDWCMGCTATGCPPDEEGAWSACVGFSDTCDEMGTRSRSVTTYTCTDDVCEPSTMMETEPCSRSRAGVTCGGGTTTSNGPCMRTGQCGTAGTFIRTTTTRACMGGSCVSSSSDSPPMACSVAAASDGTNCAAGYCCSGTCVAKSDNRHCGVCGLSCVTAEGQTCVRAISNTGGQHDITPAQYVCTCLGFAHCRPGYGADGSCFGGHCQCSCPSAGTTCTGRCPSGVCDHDTDPSEPESDNFCRYP